MTQVRDRFWWTVGPGITLNLWEIHFSRDLRTCSSTLCLPLFLAPGPKLRSSSTNDLLPSFFVFLRLPLLSFSSSAVLRSSLQGCPKNPLLSCCLLSLTRGNSRDKHTSLLYKTMATLVTEIFNAYRRVASGRESCFSWLLRHHLLRRRNHSHLLFIFNFAIFPDETITRKSKIFSKLITKVFIVDLETLVFKFRPCSFVRSLNVSRRNYKQTKRSSKKLFLTLKLRV